MRLKLSKEAVRYALESQLILDGQITESEREQLGDMTMDTTGAVFIEIKDRKTANEVEKLALEDVT